VADHSQMRLGRARSPFPKQARRLMFAKYAAGLASPPEKVDWTAGMPADFGVMANDRLGDCTAAGLGHMIQVVTFANGKEITLTDQEVVDFYSLSTGYSPADPNTDQGGNEIAVLNCARARGIAGHKLTAYVAIDPKDHVSIRQAVALFGGVYFGVDLPLTAQNQDVWHTAFGTPGAAPDSWGGHCVVGEAYDEAHCTLITWGERKLCTWDWLSAYASEAYALLWATEWAPGGGKAPSGWDAAALSADLAAVAA